MEACQGVSEILQPDGRACDQNVRGYADRSGVHAGPLFDGSARPIDSRPSTLVGSVKVVRRSFAGDVEDLPVGVVAQRLELDFHRWRVVLRSHPTKAPFAVSRRLHLRVMIGRPISVSNAATRTNGHVQQHPLYPQNSQESCDDTPI